MPSMRQPFFAITDRLIERYAPPSDQPIFCFRKL
jgi:hypothetical protein